MTDLTPKFKRIRSRIFRDMIRATDSGLHEYDITFKPTLSELRGFWSTATNCAVIRQAVASIQDRERRYYFR